MKTTTKMLIVQFLCHVGFVAAIVYGEWWMWIISLVWYFFVTTTSATAGHHRYYAHRSFEAPKWYPWMVNILNLFVGTGPNLTRAATHRMHHDNTDTEEDPSSPKHRGVWKIYFNMWGYDTKLKRKYLKGLVNDPILRLFHEYHFRFLFGIVFILAMIDPVFLLFAFCVPSTVSFHAWGAANLFTHIHGYPERVPWIGILTCGEGNHEHHHKEPRDPRISKYDLGWLWIDLIQINSKDKLGTSK